MAGHKGNTNASKLEPFLEAAEQVLFDDINAIIFTDQELIDEINEHLGEKQQITRRTFQNWKQRIKEGDDLNGKAQSFFILYKKALRRQKNQLFKKFRNDKGQWQRWAWIIERKFDEWNIKHKMEHDGNLDSTVSVEFVDSED